MNKVRIGWHIHVIINKYIHKQNIYDINIANSNNKYDINIRYTINTFIATNTCNGQCHIYMDMTF